MGRKAKHAGVSAKVAIFEVLCAIKDGSYLKASEIAARAKAQRFVEERAVITCLNSELVGVLEVVDVEADSRIRKIHAMARAYRWPQT